MSTSPTIKTLAPNSHAANQWWAAKALFKRLATSKLLQSSGLSVLDQAIVSGTSFVTSIILGRCCGREDLGVYYLALSIVFLVRGMQEQLVSAPYMIFCGRQAKEYSSRYAGSSLLHQCVISLLAIASLAVVAIAGWSPVGMQSSLWLLLSAAPLLWMREYIRQVAFANLDVRAAIVTDATIAATQLGGLSYLAWLGELNVQTALAVMGICCGLACVSWLASGRQHFVLSWSAAWQDWCRNWTFSRWALASHLLACTAPYVLPWIVALTHGERETGTLGACATLVGLSNMFLIGLANYLSPKAARAYAEHGLSELKRVLKQTATLFVVGLGTMSVMAFLAGNHVAALVYGPEFSDTRWIIGILSLSVLANSLGVTAGNGLWALERPSASFVADLCSLIVTIVATAALIPAFGPLGAALAGLAGTSSDALIRGWTLKRTLREVAESQTRVEGSEMSSSALVNPPFNGLLTARDAGVIAKPIDQVQVFTQTFWFAFAGILIGTLLSEHNLFFSQMEDFAHGEDKIVAGAGGGNLLRRLSFFVVGIVGLAMIVAAGKIPWKIRPVLALIYAAPFALSAVSYLWSIDTSMCLRRLIVRTCCVFAAFGMGRLFSLRQICWLAVLVMGSCIGIGVLAEIGLGTFRPWSGSYRFSGTQHPNPQGMYLAGCCFAALALAWNEKKYRPLLICVAVSCVVLLLLTKSRSATAALLITAAAVLLLQTTLRFKLFAGLSGIWLLGVIVLVIWLSQIDALRQLGEAALMGRKEHSESLSGRNFIWPLAQHFISQRPWLGHGFESFWTADHVQFVADELQFPVVEAHNGYLEVMLSTGRIGLGLHLLAVVAGIAAAARHLWKTGDPSCGFITAVLIYSLLSASFESTMFGLFFVTLSAWAGVAHLAFGGAEETSSHAHA